MLTLNDKVWIRVKAAFLRITLTRVTAAFFLFGFVHCFAQGILQSFIFTYDDQYSSFLNDIVKTSEFPHHHFAWLTREHGTFDLKICEDIADNGIPSPCHTVFATRISDSPAQQDTTPVPDAVRNMIRWQRRSGPTMTMTPSRMTVTALRNETGGVDGVALAQKDGSDIRLSLQCTQVLVYPSQVLSKNKREASVLIAIQFWLFSISFIAIMYDSVPHTLAVLIARFLATAWSAYVLWRTTDIQLRFMNLVTKPESPCHIDMFTPYFTPRFGLEVADLILNFSALTLSCGLSWNLLKMYGAQVFKRAGPPLAIVRIYRYFLTVHVSLVLSVFCLVTAAALWFDQLLHSPLGQVASNWDCYVGLFIATGCLLPIWIIVGYIAVRREHKKLMALFLFLTFSIIVGWSSMFYSSLYRWTLIDWPFLLAATIASYLDLVINFTFGVLSFINFGKGLADYMNVEDDLRRVDFEHDIFPIKRVDTESDTDTEKGAGQSTISLYVPTLQSDQEKAAKNWF